jgi:hypothetical protein
MENFKLATRQKLRFQTNKGLLSTEQLWDLPIVELDALAVALEDEYKESGKKSFLVKSSAKDKTIKLKFDVVLDVLSTKVEEQQVVQETAEIREHNKKIIAIIADKKDRSLQGKSIKELEGMLR